MALKKSLATINVAALSLIASTLLASCGTHRSGQSQLNGRPSVDGTTAEFKRIFDSAKKISSPEDLKAVPIGDVCAVARDAFDTPDDPRDQNSKGKLTFSKTAIGSGLKVVGMAPIPSDFYIVNGEAQGMGREGYATIIVRARLTENSALVFERIIKDDRGAFSEKTDPSTDFSGYSLFEYILTTAAPVNGQCQ